MKRFNDKAVIITGADSEIGRVTALRLAREGANVILIGMNSDILSDIAEELPLDHTWINAGNHLTVTSDISNKQQTAQLVNYVVDKYEKVDALINLNTNFDIEQALLSELIKTKGNIVNVSLISETQSGWGIEGYGSNHAEFTKTASELALKYGRQGMRVNAVIAGLTTEHKDEQANVSQFLAQSPLGELIGLEAITDAIAFLASADASMITGVTLPVDGGFSLTID